MPIDGLIILDETGRPIIQTNFRNAPASYPLLHVDTFNDTLAKSPSGQIDPILYIHAPNGPSACCHIECGGMRILCPVSSETDPLFVFTFLQQFVDILHEYLGDVSASSLKESFDVVYQLLEEMIDDGYPLTTESNTLRDIVLPPSFVNKVLSVAGVAGLAKVSVAPFSSPIPWRKTGVRYNNNEIYFDITEELDAIVHKTGTVVSSTVWGKIKSNCRLSGTPDLTLTFHNAQVLSDCSFHPCVRLQRWARDKAISFVPPDRYFTLLEYRFVPATGITTGKLVPPPFFMRPVVTLTENGGSIDLTLSSRVSGKLIEGICIELYLGTGALGASCLVSSGSTWGFDPSKHLLQWEIPSMSPLSTHTLQGSFNSTDLHPRPARAFKTTFEIPQHSFSLLKIDQLKVIGESYKPYKGVRGQVRGTIEFRW